MKIKRKINDRGNGSCQIVVPKKVMEHIGVVAGDEINYIANTGTDYVILKRAAKEIEAKTVFTEVVMDFYYFLEENKRKFKLYGLEESFYYLVNTLMMIKDPLIDLKTVMFLLDRLELESLTLLGSGEDGSPVDIFTNQIANKYFDVEEVFNKVNQRDKIEEIPSYNKLLKSINKITEKNVRKDSELWKVREIVFVDLSKGYINKEVQINFINTCLELLEVTTDNEMLNKEITTILEESLEQLQN